jgi:hypothetical protein
MITEGVQKSEDRHDWHFEIRERANQHVLTVAFSDISDAKLTSQSGAGSLAVLLSWRRATIVEKVSPS